MWKISGAEKLHRRFAFQDRGRRSGDRRHLIVLGHYEGIRILSPRAFLEELSSDQV